MPDRTAKFVSAIFASVLAGIPLATISHGATPRDGGLPFRSEGPDARWQPLVLSHRSRHQTSLLVSPKGEKLSQNALLRIPLRRQSRLRRMQKPRCSVRSQTLTPNCPRRRISNEAETRRLARDGGQPLTERRAQRAAADAATQRSSPRVGLSRREVAGSPVRPATTVGNPSVAAPPDSTAAPSPAAAAVTLAAADFIVAKQSGSDPELLRRHSQRAGARPASRQASVFKFGSARRTGRRRFARRRQADLGIDR